MSSVLIPKETLSFETRVAATPDSVKKLKSLGLELFVEKGAGEKAHFSDTAYAQAGAHLVASASDLETCTLCLAVNPPSPQQLSALPPSVILAGMLGGKGGDLAECQTVRRAFSLELMPRVSRAQSMDVLSSQSTISGYGAVIEAACRAPGLFPLLMTAGGTVPPSRVLVLGAGVAGLQAIATAKRLGAQVYALDVRPAAKEQVESLGGVFVKVEGESGEDASGYAKEMGASYQERQVEALTALLPQIDVVVATALIPGKPAPRILTEALMSQLKPGAVVVDLAVETGGNCAFSRPNEVITTPQGVVVVGDSRLACRYPKDASSLYARNLYEFVKLMWDPSTQTFRAPATDELLAATCIWDRDSAQEAAPS
jgi:NAD(P) transhydrogenase subunit alpha